MYRTVLWTLRERERVGRFGQKLSRLVHRASLVAQMVKNLLAMQETWVRSLRAPSAQRLVWAAKQPLGNAALGALFA